MTPKERDLLTAIAQAVAYGPKYMPSDKPAFWGKHRDLVTQLLEEVRAEDGTGVAPKTRLVVEGEKDALTLAVPELDRTLNRARVKSLCERIGYGAVMHYAEDLWAKVEGDRKGNHTVGPCAIFMVTCEHQGSDNGAVGCDWCCGSGRVTTRVLEAMRDASATKANPG